MKIPKQYFFVLLIFDLIKFVFANTLVFNAYKTTTVIDGFSKVWQ